MGNLLPKQMHRGIFIYLTGISWLVKHPLFLFLLFLPMMLGFTCFFVLGFATWTFIQGWFTDIFPFIAEQSSWWHLFWIYPLKGIFYFSCYVILMVICFILTTLLSVPILEFVSQRVEADLFGKVIEVPLSISSMVFAIKEESKKLVFIAFVSLVLLVIPGVNFLGIFVSAFLLGWDYYDYALARRNYHFIERLKWGLRDFWPILGLGLWQLIPFLQFFLMPLTVVGGTMLSLERIQKLEHTENVLGDR